MFAIIQTGGKQYRVEQGDVIYVEKLDAQPEQEVTFDVLLLGDADSCKVGSPLVEGASVKGKLVKQVKSAKVVVFKYRSKKNSRKKQGHRQPYSKVEITAIEG